MTYAAVSIPDGLWGVDVDCELTDAMLDVLLSTDLHGRVAGAEPGSLPRVIVRYVGLGGPARGDIASKELQRIVDRPERPILVLVQHVEAGLWTADGPTGTLHGNSAAADAKLAGYDAALYAGLSLIVDMESVKNPGPSSLLYVQDWLVTTYAQMFGKSVYEGFAAGLTGQQLLDLLCPLWADFGPRTLPGGATFAAKQHAPIKIGGTEYDPDQFFVDSRGYALVGLQQVDDAAPPDVPVGPANPITGDPHA